MSERAEERTANWLTGPVAVTGADGHVGRSLQRRLADRPNPVRPLRRADIWSTAIGDADAVIHLAGTLQPRRPDTYQAGNVGTVERLALVVVVVSQAVIVIWWGDAATGTIPNLLVMAAVISFGRWDSSNLSRSIETGGSP